MTDPLPPCTVAHGHLFRGDHSGCEYCGIAMPQALLAKSPAPSSYQQGLRDGLITARSLLLMSQDLDIALRGLTEQLDKSNLDLWSLLALAQAVVPPEAQALRDHLRAPSGVLIDSAGRMLFLRLKGIEYDTGVLALQAELANLKEALTDHPALKSVDIIVNGQSFTVHLTDSEPIFFDTIVDLSGIKHADAVTFRGKGKLGDFSGIMSPGTSLIPSPGMIFNVARTGSA